MSAKQREAKLDGKVDGKEMEATLDELREFIEADMLDVKANPEFKEQLRKQLWALLQAQSDQARRSGGG